MSNPHAARTQEIVAATRARARDIEHDWDRRALEWPLTRESTVVEVGGYCGRWALQIAERYAPRLFVFEPQPWAADVCRAVLKGRAMVFDYALGATAGAMLMGDWETDGCSLVKAGAEHPATMVEIGATFRQLKIKHIDLMLMNIEGYEFTLIPHMLRRGILPQRLMVQVHEFAGAAGAIHEALAAHGYKVLWTYGAILTAWERD